MKWYLFAQNNSGGQYVAGPRNIIVLANSEEEAADRLLSTLATIADKEFAHGRCRR
jgi:hypothetical protein